jgi:hypothetical protein
MCAPEPGLNTPEDVVAEARRLAERDGIIERRMNTDNVHVWKWIAASLLGVLMLLLGAFGGDVAASFRYSGLHQRMTDHERLPGHPVMVQKVNDLDESINESLARIENKMERQSIVLREIEQGVRKNGN